MYISYNSFSLTSPKVYGFYIRNQKENHEMLNLIPSAVLGGQMPSGDSLSHDLARDA